MAAAEAALRPSGKEIRRDILGGGHVELPELVWCGVAGGCRLGTFVPSRHLVKN